MSPFLHSRVIVCLLFLVSLGLGSMPNGTTAQTGTSIPVLHSALLTQLPAPLVSVSGQGFTTGGLVYVALYDQWGQELKETRWTVATTPFWGPNGSSDPASGYRPGGSISEVFALETETVYGPNGSMDPAQGYVEGNGQSAANDAIYGPNGSQDPANGYVPAATLDLTCAYPLMVRAFDQQSQSWSNTLDVIIGC